MGRRRPATADGRKAELDVAAGELEIMGELSGGVIAFGDEDAEPLPGVTALEHGRARSACRQAQTMPEFPTEIRNFAKPFVVLQIERQKADYALDTAAYRTSDVPGYIVSAERARFEQADMAAGRAFAAHVPFRQRTS